MTSNLTSADRALVASILAGDALPAAAMGRADLYDALNAGANGPLPFLGTSSKIAAGESVDVLGAVLYMMPANASGREACPGRSAGCTAACLAEGTGRMSMSDSQRARRRRHASFYADRGRFLADLHTEIASHRASAIRAGKVPAIRLNGTTDLPWHRMRYTDHGGTAWARIHDAFPDVRFYEYTKIAYGIQAKGGLPANLHLTFSVSERDDAEVKARPYLDAGFGAAVVIDAPKHAHPDVFSIDGDTWSMVDGDAHDARFLDPAGSIVALAAKGRAKSDTTGFVRAV
jgi:hypothetical protein